jgi:hypothetical protein
MNENELFFRQISRKMYNSVHTMQSANKTDTKVVSPRSGGSVSVHAYQALIHRKRHESINRIPLR